MPQETRGLTVEQVSRKPARDSHRTDATPFDHVKLHPAVGVDIWKWVIAQRGDQVSEERLALEDPKKRAEGEFLGPIWQHIFNPADRPSAEEQAARNARITAIQAQRAEKRGS